MANAFHEVRFPLDIALGSLGGPERRTEIVTLSTGHEERNTRWADSRRRYNAGYGVKSLAQLHTVLDFFEERRGRLSGFRWKDRADDRSCPPGTAPGPLDQTIGEGDGTRLQFQLAKTYGAAFSPWRRTITKPVLGTVRVAVNGVEQAEGVDFTSDWTTGLVTFAPASVPPAGAMISAGFEFDVPVRFDTDYLEIDHDAFAAGAIPSIPLVEIRL
ncbi:MAG: DUF2460 domain-containing protein [Hyphomicrobiales bacterium]